MEDRHVGRHDFCVRTSVHSGYVMFCDPLMMENKSWSKTSRHLNFLLLKVQYISITSRYSSAIKYGTIEDYLR